MRRDFETADRVLPTIPKEHRTRVAHFLEKQVRNWLLPRFVCAHFLHTCLIPLQGFKEQALQVSTDPEHCFELALQIGNLTIAHALAKESNNPQKWSQLAEAATSQNKFELVQECLTKANDFGSLLMLATCSGKNTDLSLTEYTSF